MTGGADILFGFIPAVEVITGLFAGRQDACAGFKLADIERSAVDLVVVLIEVVEMDRPVPVCRDNAVAGRASRDLGDLLAVLVVPLKERLAPVSTGRIGQRDGIALNRVRRGVGAGGLAVVVYILNGVLNGRKFAVELPFLGHVQLFDLSFYANISCFLIPAAEFVTIFCIRSPQAVGGIVNRVNRVHLLFYPRTGFIREVVLDCERLLFPVRVQVRPAVDGLVGDVRGLAFAAPEGEGVAVAGRSGRVCGGQSRANAGLGGTEDALRLGVVVLICRQRFQRIEVNDRNQLGDDELEILPVSGDQQLLQSGGFILQTVQIPLVAVEHAVVVPAAVDLEVEIEIAARIDLRKVNRIASKLIGGVRNIHDRLAQIAGLEDHEVDVGLFGFPLRNIGHSLRDRCRNFGLPACEGVAGAGRGAVERGGRGILPKVRIDLIGENFFVLNAVGVGDGVYLRHMHAALRLELPAAPDPDQRDRNDLLIVLDMFQVLERRVERGHIEVGDIADVAKPVVPVLPRLADEVVFIVNAEQIVGFRMLLRSIYDALDLNSHVKLFQLVSRRGFGLAGDLDDRADRPQAVHRDELPLCILPNPAHRGDCVGVGVFVARKVFVKFFYVLIPKDRNGIRPDAIDLLNRWVGFCVAAKLRHVIPLFIRLVLAYYPNILLPAGNDRLCGRGLGLVAFDFNVSINAVRATNQVPRAILPPPVDAGFLVWLRIGVGSADLLIELRNVFRSVQSDGIDVSIFRPIPTEVFV